MIKIRVSFTTKQELEKVKDLLKPIIVSCKISKCEKGQYKKAYIELNHLDNSEEC